MTSIDVSNLDRTPANELSLADCGVPQIKPLFVKLKIDFDNWFRTEHTVWTDPPPYFDSGKLEVHNLDDLFHSISSWSYFNGLLKTDPQQVLAIMSIIVPYFRKTEWTAVLHGNYRPSESWEGMGATPEQIKLHKVNEVKSIFENAYINAFPNSVGWEAGWDILEGEEYNWLGKDKETEDIFQTLIRNIFIGGAVIGGFYLIQEYKK